MIRNAKTLCLHRIANMIPRNLANGWQLNNGEVPGFQPEKIAQASGTCQVCVFGYLRQSNKCGQTNESSGQESTLRSGRSYDEIDWALHLCCAPIFIAANIIFETETNSKYSTKRR